MDALLETEDLVTNFYTYEGVVKALNKVSLVIDRGVTFGLVGESGCGKSVTTRSIMRIVPDPGRIEGGKVLLPLDEKRTLDLLQQSETSMRHLRGNQISMIFQEPNAALNPTMRIGTQVAESYLFHQQQEMCRQVYKHLTAAGYGGFGPWKAYLRWVYRIAGKRPNSLGLRMLSSIPILARWRRPMLREAERRAVEMIRQLGIAHADAIARQYPHNLSGGMKQRIVIAMALACGPVLLIADEATSNLDVSIQAQILELLKNLKKTVITSILLITHDLGVVAETCDRVAVMYAGNVVEVANVTDLFARPLHPYTRALLNSVPKRTARGPLQSIEGAVPNLVHPPTGCRFHPRCPHAMEKCRKTIPELTHQGATHYVACFLY